MKAILVALNDDYSGDPAFPPIGSTGEVVSGPDDCGDYDILFPDWPCHIGDPCWICHKSMLVLIDDGSKAGTSGGLELVGGFI